MKNSSDEVAEFFDSIAGKYGDKYERANPFHHYFFNERLDEAVRGFDFKKKKILDIGAGTGRLYDRIVGLEPDLDYFAIDISGEMLGASAIPPDRRFVGTLADVSLPIDSFDLVFLLGVTTYINDDDLKKLLVDIDRLLDHNGRAIITFTNRSSADWMLRRAFKKIPGIRRKKEFVLSQEFPTYARSIVEIIDMIDDLFTIERSVGLNHTIFPLSHILKGPSVAIARRIHRMSVRSSSLPLSSDILIEVSKKSKPQALDDVS